MHKPFFILATLFGALMTAGCDTGDKGRNILDAAAIYEANPETFASIRRKYPGPYRDFVRVPARDPGKATREGTLFIKQLRKNFPVEFVDFFPLAGTGNDEIDVVIERYGANTSWTVISLVYSELQLTPADDQPNMALFDKCDHRSLDWLEAHRGTGRISVSCRINDYWYAFQSVN
jgi:hypothetical protein